MARKPKRYSIAYLLKRQTAGFKKHPRYPELIYRFSVSPVIKRLRITSRCYRILNNAMIPEKNLPSFYRTYRLPKDPFFSIFIAIKSEVLEKKRSRKKAKEDWIKNEMKNVPDYLRTSMGELREFEMKLNRAGKCPEWEKTFIPATKKRVCEMKRGDIDDWTEVFDAFLERIKDRYGRSIPTRVNGVSGGKILLSLIVLGFPFSIAGMNIPAKNTINERYRRLSKKFHPDLGGDERHFVVLKQARDILLR